MTNADQLDPMRSIVNRLQRIEGQVRGLQRMLEQERDGAEVLTQVSAVLSATRRAAGAIAEMHIHKCLDETDDPDNSEALARLRAVVDAFSRLD